MFFVDKPYISDFLKMTIRDNAIPIVGTDTSSELNLLAGTKVVSETEAVEMAQKSDVPTIYFSSENSIGWISKHLSSSVLLKKIELFKDKLKFRELIKPIFPNFYFKKIRVEDLNKVQFDEFPLPFIIKPIIGFFSMGVYRVSNREEWVDTINSIAEEMDRVKNLYPGEVLNPNSFIIEQCIEGDEFAIDVYFDSAGEPVILSVFKHIFSSEAHVSDRVYITSKSIIENNLEEFTDFTVKIGELADVKNFPMHIELRRDADSNLLPIEINPMRFGGWCTTADMTYLAYGFNPYIYYYKQKKTHWPAILKDKVGKLFSIVILDNSTGIDTDKILSFDYEKLLSHFEKPLELRKIDFKKYPVFGVLFTETREDNYNELINILDSDLNEFITTNARTA